MFSVNIFWSFSEVNAFNCKFTNFSPHSEDVINMFFRIAFSDC